MSAYLMTTLLSDEPIYGPSHAANMLALMIDQVREGQASNEPFTDNSRLSTLETGHAELELLKRWEANSHTRTTAEPVSEIRTSKHLSRIRSLFSKKGLTETTQERVRTTVAGLVVALIGEMNARERRQDLKSLEWAVSIVDKKVQAIQDIRKELEGLNWTEAHKDQIQEEGADDNA